MNEEDFDFRQVVDELAGGYRASQILLCANRLNLFSSLAERMLTAGELSTILDCDERGLRILCDALTSLSLLEKEDGRYRNTPQGREMLAEDSPRSLRAMLWHASRLYERWGVLYDIVKTGKPAPDSVEDSRLPSSKKDFAQAMAAVGHDAALRTAEVLDLSSSSTLLDVGGGPGLYSIAFVRKNPQLKATVLDDEETLEITRKNIDSADLGSKILLKPGDIFQDELQESFDFVFVSNVVHMFSEDENCSLVRRCAALLNKGGRLCLKDFFLDSDRTTPSWAAVFAVNMLVNTDAGDCFTTEQATEWLRSAGLSTNETVELPPHSRLVIGKR